MAIADKCLGITKNYINNKLRQEKFTRKELEKIVEYMDAKYNESPPFCQCFNLNDTGEDINPHPSGANRQGLTWFPS